MNKKLFSLILSIALIKSSVYAVVNGTPKSTNPLTNITCSISSEQAYFPVGDTRGNSILSKREVVRECDVSIIEQGACKRWEEKVENKHLTPGTYNTYESRNHADSVGSLFSALGAYDQIEHLWSGWKGYCEIGTKADFSWAEDPMFWASMAMSMIMSGTAEGGFLSDSSVSTAVNGASETMGTAIGDVAKNAGTDLAESSVDSAVESAMTDPNISGDALQKVAEDAASQYYTNLGRCVVAAGFNVATTLYEFYDESSSAITCDPVDEICQTGAEGTEQEEIRTMDEVQFNDMVDVFASNNPPMNLYDYVFIIPPSPENGIVRFRMKHANEFSGFENMNSEEIEKLKQQIKEMQAGMSIAMTTLSFSACAGGLSNGDISQRGGDTGRVDLRQYGSMAIDAAAKFAGPYGAIIAAMAKVALYTITSYKDVDTCHDKDDAQEASKREEQTQKAVDMNLCHFIKSECKDSSNLLSNWVNVAFFPMAVFQDKECALYGYFYCCYDQLLSKILVEQLKAQLGRDWSHCTGINLRDLNYVSFRQCTDAEIIDSSTIDGAHQVGEYDPKKAFQYKYKCVDLTEFKEYLSAQIGGEINKEDFDNFFNDIANQSNKLN